MPVQQGHGHNVLKHGTMRQQPTALHNIPDGSAQLVGVLVCNILTADSDRAFLRLTMRLIMRRVVVLPHPEEPTKTVVSPAGMLRVRLLTTVLASRSVW